MAKRIKTWIWWARIVEDEPCGYLTQSAHDGDTKVRVLMESDYRKMCAVYNAAMKWAFENPALDQTKVITALQKACERARK